MARVLFANIKGPPGAPGEPGPQGPPGPMPEVGEIPGLDEALSNLQASIDSVNTAVGQLTVIVETPVDISKVVGLSEVLTGFETMIQELFGIAEQPITIDKVTGLEEALAADIPTSRVAGLDDLVDDAVENVLPGLIVAVPEANWPPADTPGVIYVRVP